MWENEASKNEDEKEEEVDGNLLLAAACSFTHTNPEAMLFEWKSSFHWFHWR